VRGVDLAIEAERRIAFQPSVTIYSAKRLYLQPPVVETELSDANAAYRYEYTGLKLLFRSEHNFFLRPSDPSDSRNIVIAESPDLRFEFSR
jgi:YHS domain-containing protein